MKSGAVILGVVVSVLLLAAGSALYVLSGSYGDSRHYRAALTLVREIRQLSSEWSIEAARVRSDPLADFDSLTAFVPRITRLKESLSDTTRRIPDLPDRLASDIGSYLGALDAKEERIERFKTGYAVVRNSTRYLPLAAANATRQAQEANDEALAQRIALLSHDLNSYLATPTRPVGDRLSEELQQLREASVSHPILIANTLANLISHAEVLLARQEPTTELFQEATSNEISTHTDRLVRGLETELGRKEMRATRYERGSLAATVAVLALFWGLLAWQQRGFGRRAAAAPAARDASAPAAPAPRTEAPSLLPEADEAMAWEASGSKGAAGVISLAPEAGPGDAAREAAAYDPERSAGVISLAPEAGPGDAAREAAAYGPERSAGVISLAPGAGPGDTPPAAAAVVSSPQGRDGARAGTHAESAMLHGFLIEFVAGNLAASASRITTCMDHLRQSQDRIRGVLHNGDAGLESSDGAGLDEELEAAAAAASRVRRDVNALADLAKRLTSLSKASNGRADYGMVDVNACIDEVVDAAETDGAATVAKNLRDIPEIFASKGEIRLLLAKLFENSVLAVRGLEDRMGIIKIDTARKNDEVLITIIDNGIGMTPERARKVFEPFYTSRNGAMGIGLTVADHVARRHRGLVTVNSLPGQGTVIRVALPAGLPGP